MSGSGIRDEEHGILYADYYSAMVDSKGMLREDLSTDDIHPNAAGYAIMAPIAQAAIRPGPQVSFGISRFGCV